MNKKVNFDFYRIEMPSVTSVVLENNLHQLMQLSIDKRFREVRQHQVCLYNADSTWQQTWEGEMVRLRMNDLPIKGNLSSGQIGDIVLKEDEGIGEKSAFLYHPSTRVLVLQSSKTGISPVSFAEYFELVNNFSDSIYVDPVLQSTTMGRLDKIKTISEFDVRVAALDNMSFLKGYDCGVQEIINLNEFFGSPIISLKLSTGRKGKKGKISVENVKSAVQSLLRMSAQNPQKVKNIRISGSTEENESLYIDLLKDRMREDVDIDSGKSRTVPYDKRKQVIREVWNRRQHELINMFVPP